MKEVERNIYYALRLAAAMCFLGHGAFGIITKEIWCNYFGVFGIGHQTAYKLMPWVGTMDVFCGISLLLYPTRAVLSWLVIWGTITALLRPLSGEPFAEFIERAGNFGAPLALLIFCTNGGKNLGGWFALVTPPEYTDAKTLAKVTTCLKAIVFLLLIGHGWLNLAEKKAILSQYSSLGFSNAANVGYLVGIFEFMAAIMVLVRPLRPLIFAFFLWKMTAELFYPHWEMFEWIERGGSYGVLLALWLALPRTKLTMGNINLSRSPART